MSIKLWNDVEDLKGEVEKLKKKLAVSVSLEDVTELLNQNQALAARVEKLEKKGNKSANG